MAKYKLPYLALLLQRAQHLGFTCPSIIYLYWQDDNQRESFVETACHLLEKENIPCISDKQYQKVAPESEQHVRKIENQHQRSIHALIRKSAIRGVGTFSDTIANKYNLTRKEVNQYLKQMSLPIKEREQPKTSDFWLNPQKLTKSLSRREILAFMESRRAGSKEVMNFLIKNHLRLVAGFGVSAKPAWCWNRDDAQQEGFFGLYTAAKKYRPTTSKANFSTFAANWIKLRIGRARFVWQHNSGSRSYRYQGKIIQEVQKFIDEFAHTHSKLPKPEDIANEYELPINESRRILHPEVRATTEKEKQCKLGQIFDHSASSTEQVEQEDLQNVARQKLNEWLQYLDGRSRYILSQRWGLRDGREYTLEEIGRYWGITRERVRQIEHKAIKKLQHLFGKEKEAQRIF